MTQDPKIYLQFGGTDLITRANRRRRERKGLEAIFTSQKEGMKIEILTGAAGIMAGLFLSVVALFRADAPQALGPWGDTIYSALTFGSLGALLVICGGGTIMFATAHRETKLQTTSASPTSDLDPLGVEKDHEGTGRMFGPGSRIGAIAFVQSVALVALYSGFVQEFESNATMQSWIKSNFPVGQSLLSWEGVLILSVSLSLLLVQFLPGRALSE